MVKIAAVGDLHCNRNSHKEMQALFAQVAQTAEILLLCGDLIDYGLPEEAAVLAGELNALKMPVLAVLGNHDFEAGKLDQVCRQLTDAGAIILDGNSYEIGDVGFAGVKGFAGGFGERAMQPWGEETIKRFVREATGEALKLETALAQLRTAHRVVLLHYAPIQATVVGEPPEIYPFLGSSRLEVAINCHPVSAVFHGHAHNGTAEGRTQQDVPVYNVAMKLLAETFPSRPPFRLIEIPGGS